MSEAGGHKPLRVLHLITTTRVGGAEGQLLELLRASYPGRLSNLVVSLEPAGSLAPAMVRAGAEVRGLGLSPGPRGLIQGVGRLRRELARFEPQVIQSWMYHADLLACLATWGGAAPPVVWGLRCADLRLKGSTRLVVAACARLSARPAAIVANSRAGLVWHRKLGYRNPRMLVIPNGFDLRQAAPEPAEGEGLRAGLGLGPEHLVVGHVASLQPVKDHPGFLQAAALVAERIPQARFVLMGRGVVAGAPDLAACGQPPLAGRCFLLGERDDVPAWLGALDMLAQSSLSEGFPNVVGEAMAAGLPVAATEVGDTGPVLGDESLLAPPADPGALAGVMIRVLEMSPGERAGLGERLRERLAEEHSSQRMSEAYQALYQSLLKPKK